MCSNDVSNIVFCSNTQSRISSPSRSRKPGPVERDSNYIEDHKQEIIDTREPGEFSINDKAHYKFNFDSIQTEQCSNKCGELYCITPWAYKETN